MTKKKVQVVGAGFSGLTCAYYLIKRGFEVEILEKDKVGGLLQTRQTAHGLVESAANAFLNSDKLQALAADIGLELIPPLKTSRARYIFREKATRFPVKFGELIFLLKFIFLIIFKSASLKPRKAESIRDWGSRQLSPTLSHYSIESALQGIYAGKPYELSASLILKVGSKQKVKRMSVSPRFGMGEFVSKLENYLKANGVIFSKRPIDFAHTVICATPAFDAATLLRQVDPEAAELLAQIDYLPIITAQIFFKQTRRKIEGFGCLFPPERGQKILGVLMNDCIFEGRAKNSISENWIMGGAEATEEFMNLPDQEIVALALRRRADLELGMAEVIDFQITRWPKAFPYYSIKLEKILEKLKTKQNIFLHGNYLGDLGLTKILERSEKLSRELA